MLSFFLNSIAALLLGFFWLRFFRQVDGFEKESWKASLSCLGMGLLSPLVTFFLSPFLNGFFDTESGNGLLGYAIIKVGMIEEFSKILPFLILLVKTDWIDESVDYIKYPALSAIGFATTENILYAVEHGMEVLHYRAVLALPGHVFFSAVCGFFLFRGSRMGSRFSPFHFLAGFCLGVLAHGLYDYFLFLGSVYSIISVVMAGLFSFYLKKMIFFSLRDSRFFNAGLLPEIFRAGRQLFLGMFLLFVFNSLSAALLQENTDAAAIYARDNGLPAMLSTLVLMFLLGLDEKGYRKVLGLPKKP